MLLGKQVDHATASVKPLPIAIPEKKVIEGQESTFEYQKKFTRNHQYILVIYILVICVVFTLEGHLEIF